MGNGILSRANSGDGAKIGTIKLSARDSLGEKWALCNGDPVTGGGINDSLMDKLSNPLNPSCWNTLWTDSNKNYRLLYHNINKEWYIVEHSGMTISIYKLNGTTKTLLTTRTFIDADFSDYLLSYDEMNLYSIQIYDYTIIPGLNRIAILMDCSYETSWWDDEIGESVYTNVSYNIICAYDIDSNSFYSLNNVYLEGSEYTNSDGESYGNEYWFFNPFYDTMNTIRKTDGHSCFGVGNYLAVVCGGGIGKTLFVLNAANDFSTTTYYDFYYERSFEYSDDLGYTVATEERYPYNMNTSYSYSNNYLGLAITYPLYDSINDELGLNNNADASSHVLDILTINATNGSIRSKTIWTIDTEQGYHSYYSRYLRDDIKHGRISCIDFENDKFGMSYFYGYYKPVPYSSTDNSYYEHIYGIIDPASTSTSGIFTKKTTFTYGTVSSGNNKYYTSNRFQIACINDKFYGIWLGENAKIMEIDVNSPTLDNKYSGLTSIPNISNYKTNSGDFIPYNDSNIILDGGSIYFYGFMPSLPLVDKPGVNAFIKIKN